ncbi:hypothetical protein M231_05483 [Tremella mesenterica]|uniref:MULE transposase domain-containing protein n=1 Tax=Tremella mesenterica TaxID=5217 RepID=A0A4Q1BI17_TREME|nr:hypothetical protein M231_05483 [Tremella mesenterica]
MTFVPSISSRTNTASTSTPSTIDPKVTAQMVTSIGKLASHWIEQVAQFLTRDEDHKEQYKKQLEADFDPVTFGNSVYETLHGTPHPYLWNVNSVRAIEPAVVNDQVSQAEQNPSNMLVKGLPQSNHSTQWSESAEAVSGTRTESNALYNMNILAVAVTMEREGHPNISVTTSFGKGRLVYHHLYAQTTDPPSQSLQGPHKDLETMLADCGFTAHSVTQVKLIRKIKSDGGRFYPIHHQVSEGTPSTESEIIIPETQQDNSPSPSPPTSATPSRDIHSVSMSPGSPDDFFAPPTPLPGDPGENGEENSNSEPNIEEDEFGPHTCVPKLYHAPLTLPPQTSVNSARQKLEIMAKDKGFALVTDSSNQNSQTPQITSLLQEYIDQGFSVHQIIDLLKEHPDEPLITPADVSNFKWRYEKNQMSGRTATKGLFLRLEQEKRLSKGLVNSKNEALCLIYTTHKARALVLLCPTVLMMDCTYNTRRYRLPMLHITGMTATNLTFTAAIAFIDRETTDWYGVAIKSFLDLIGPLKH